MAFYDMHVHIDSAGGENTPEDMAAFAKRLGFSGIGIVQFYPDFKEIPKSENIDIVNCIMLKPRNAQELEEMARKAREKCEVLMVHGGDYDINRAACENPMIDILCHPESGRKDSGLDHICMRAASDNQVAIEINFRQLLDSSKRNRVYVLSAMKKNVMLARKYNTPMVSSSGAMSTWDLRSGRELAALANLLGLDLGKAIDTASVVPENIVTKNREKLAGKRWQGVRMVD